MIGGFPQQMNMGFPQQGGFPLGGFNGGAPQGAFAAGGFPQVSNFPPVSAQSPYANNPFAGVFNALPGNIFNTPNFAFQALGLGYGVNLQTSSAYSGIQQQLNQMSMMAMMPPPMGSPFAGLGGMGGGMPMGGGFPGMMM